MGLLMSKAMDENMKKNQEFMMATQRATMERQMQMQNYMREQQMAMSLARARDMFYWWSAFYAFAFLGGVAGFRRSRRPAALVPMLPLTFIVAYQYDLSFGSKMTRIRSEAEHILKEESSLLDMPQDLPSFELLDSLRKAYNRK